MIEPQELSLQKVDAMFGFVGFTLGRVELEFHSTMVAALVIGANCFGIKMVYF